MKNAKIGWTALVIAMACIASLLLRGCTNDPWPAGVADEGTLFTNYSVGYKSLDPADAYYEHEGELLDSIVEMPLTYDYLKRPYELVPMLLESIPEPVYYGKNGEALPGDPAASEVSRVEYLLTLKPGILYQPHPCFALDAYRGKSAEELPRKSIMAFPEKGTRGMTAMDIKVGLTRLCDVRLSSPIFSTFSSFIAGMNECSEQIRQEVAALEAEQSKVGRNVERYPVVPDYRSIPLAGVEVMDDFHLKVILNRKYPQALYWMAMHFFAPVPMEALEFYSLPGVVDAGYSITFWPVGTGAYLMSECDVQDHILLEANPNYRGEPYPSEGMPEDLAEGRLEDAGKKTPFIKKIRMQYEREYIPVWTKYLQGYYDTSGIPTDMFDAAVSVSVGGDMSLSPAMEDKGMKMVSAVSAISYYLGFNMLDPVVGGMAPEKVKLRQAISIVLDFQEYIDVFMSGRGILSNFIIPPGIFGALEGKEGVNPYVNQWDEKAGKSVRQSVDTAKTLLAEAGYPNGIGADGKQLTLHFDVAGAGSDSKTFFLWLKNKMSLLGINLEERLTDTNRYRTKVSKGDWQMLFTGWVADYPDPENFLFLFYSKNGLVANGGRGSNKTNFSLPEFDAVFEKLEAMPNGPERLELIRQATRLIQEYSPCCWAMHPKSLGLTHQWLHNFKIHNMAKTFKKNLRIDPDARHEYQAANNRPVLWAPMLAIAAATALALMRIWRKQN